MGATGDLLGRRKGKGQSWIGGGTELPVSPAQLPCPAPVRGTGPESQFFLILHLVLTHCMAPGQSACFSQPPTLLCAK